ncbi:MAG: nitroreductase family protein, partial [Candidatus Parcubacteria bacterium]|nr:nitroreductase family protein [Candidatus Parcubacteria bacterium]
METLECIKTRRSRRKFLDKEVPQEIIEKIVEAGKYAPSSENSQPWHFFLIKDENLKEKFAAINYKENEDAILSCDFILVVCVDKEKSPTRFVEDGVLASQNMALAIHNLGLGCVYLSGYKSDNPEKEKNVQQLFDIPVQFMPISLLLVGYP